MDEVFFFEGREHEKAEHVTKMNNVREQCRKQLEKKERDMMDIKNWKIRYFEGDEAREDDRIAAGSFHRGASKG
jgi:hypothetical protein